MSPIYASSGLAELQDRPKYVDRRHPRAAYQLVCDQCGCEFVTPYSRKLRCSWECQERAQLRWNAKHRAARREASGV